MTPVDRRGASCLDRHGVVDRVQLDPVRPIPGQLVSNSILVSSKSGPKRSIQMYLLHEALARERMREQREQAMRRRLSHELASARRWQRLAAYSAGRAARSRRQLAEQSAAAEYQLVG